jgi:alanine racemase
MGRLGISGDRLEGALQRLSRFRTLDTIGLTSHLSSADESSTEFTDLQIERFRTAISTGRAMGFRLPCNDLANSAAVIRHKGSHFEMVRPGIMLYGGLPSPEFRGAPPLKPVMRYAGEVLQVRDMPDCTPVSYGRTCYTEGARRTAILSSGYGDGIPRHLSNLGFVLIRRRRCRILGTVCMNMVVCDVTELRDVVPGDEAVFLGAQGGEVITGDQMAQWANTISYEIFCSIGQRHTKEYVS